MPRKTSFITYSDLLKDSGEETEPDTSIKAVQRNELVAKIRCSCMPVVVSKSIMPAKKKSLPADLASIRKAIHEIG